ncbi:hypothetical protein M758_5G019700 [Ceratodon purpureus]|nr:hypothetical protein M758_5G019700 [Ceratodon purpureus]
MAFFRSSSRSLTLLSLRSNSSLQYSRVDFIFCKSRTRISINCACAPKSALDSSKALTSNVKSSVCFLSLSSACCCIQTCPFLKTSTCSFFTFNSFCRSLHRFSTLRRWAHLYFSSCSFSSLWCSFFSRDELAAFRSLLILGCSGFSLPFMDSARGCRGDSLTTISSWVLAVSLMSGNSLNSTFVIIR